MVSVRIEFGVGATGRVKVGVGVQVRVRAGVRIKVGIRVGVGAGLGLGLRFALRVGVEEPRAKRGGNSALCRPTQPPHCAEGTSPPPRPPPPSPVGTLTHRAAQQWAPGGVCPSPWPQQGRRAFSPPSQRMMVEVGDGPWPGQPWAERSAAVCPEGRLAPLLCSRAVPSQS